MATRMELPPFARFTFPARISFCLAFLRLPSFLFIFFTVISQASAQTAQQYVYLSLPGWLPSSPSSLISGFSKAGQTGALTSVSGSPFTDRLEGGLVAVDGQGKFLFILNPTSNDISMFQIDQASGALSEVPGSPFAVPPAGTNPAPSRPISMSAEPSGKFLFVGFFNGHLPGNSAIVPYFRLHTGPLHSTNPRHACRSATVAYRPQRSPPLRWSHSRAQWNRSRRSRSLFH